MSQDICLKVTIIVENTMAKKNLVKRGFFSTYNLHAALCPWEKSGQVLKSGNRKHDNK